MPNFINHPTGRIDTTVTDVEVTTGNASSLKTRTNVAVQHVKDRFPGTNILAVWHTGRRGDHGFYVWSVEHDPGDDS